MTAIPARFAAHVGETIKNLPGPDKEELHDAVIRACNDPWSWPQADKYDGMDEAVGGNTSRTPRGHEGVKPGARPP
ncbi:hypothetical protein ACWGQ5_55405, partial [Streptomyces sp. NPDC055722]